MSGSASFQRVKTVLINTAFHIVEDLFLTQKIQVGCTGAASQRIGKLARPESAQDLTKRRRATSSLLG